MVLTMVGVSTMAEDAVVSRCRSLPASIDSRYDPRQVLKSAELPVKAMNMKGDIQYDQDACL